MTDMTPNLLDELEERLGELKSTLAIMAKYAPAPGVLCAPTMEMGLGWKAKALLPKIEAAHTALADMAKRLEAAERDAARYRWLRERSYGQHKHPIVVEQRQRILDGDCIGTLYVGPLFGDLLDAAIDATQEGEG